MRKASVPSKDHTPSFYSFLLNRPPLPGVLLFILLYVVSSLMHIHANLLGTYSMPGTVPGIAVSGGHSRTGSGPYIGSHSLSAAQWTSHLAFSVSLKATSPRTCLDTQNTYILKALMYSTTLSSRSESRSVRPTLCNPKDYTVHGILQVRILEPFPSPGDRPNPGIEPRSPTLHADSLPAEPQGKSYSHQHEDWYV